MYDECERVTMQETKQDMYAQHLNDRLSFWQKLTVLRSKIRQADCALDAMHKEECELINKMNENHKQIAALDKKNGLDYGSPNGITDRG